MEEKKKVKLSTVIIIVILLIIALVAAIIFRNKPTNTNTTNQVTKNNAKDNTQTTKPEVIIDKSELTMSFLKLENEKKNIIYSPLSIKYALSMLRDGSNGNTKLQIEKLLGNAKLTQYENKEKVLSLANSIYIKKDYKKNIKEDYTNTLIQKYNAEIQYDSFKNARNINKWIEQKTLGIIKDMLSDEAVQGLYTKMLLINALAIDMEWETQFKQSDTYGEEFYLADGTTMQATTMHKDTLSNAIAYYKDNKITSITMDLKEYEGTQLEFIAVMPNDNKLSEYVSKTTIEDINKIVEKSTPASKTKTGVKIKIPKFEYNYDLKLKEDLEKLGMTDAFDASLADLSKITDTNFKLFVSDALHKADIKFSEKGVKAAAVTVFVQDTMSIEGQEKPQEIIIDKPFLYVLRDKSTKEVWFVGTVYEPNSWEKDEAEYYRQ